MDECYQGACGNWITIESVINTEEDRRAWARSESFVSDEMVEQCHECADRPDYVTIVILGVPTAFGPAAAVPRIRNLRYGPDSDEDLCDGHCFEVRLQEPPCYDDVHMAEQLSWLVLESGTWYADVRAMRRRVVYVLAVSLT